MAWGYQSEGVRASGPAGGVVDADRAGVDADGAGLEPIRALPKRWPTVLAALVMLLMVAGLARELFDQGLAGLQATVPDNPLFFAVILVLYVLAPLCDFAIFRRLWGIPADGLTALFKKRIANEVVLGYSGDAYFYAWARQRTHIVAAPFGAVKDVGILSAIAANVVTLAAIAVALPFAGRLVPAELMTSIWWSAAVVAAMSMPFLLYSRRIFSLPRARLRWIFGVQLFRLVAGSMLVALAWALALPGVAIGTWLVLSAGRLLISRAPFVPGKDLIFANVAILLIGDDAQLADVIALTAALTLLLHVALVALFGARALLVQAQ